MGKQINYYMDLESYKLLVQKAFKLGFKVVVEDKKDIKIYDSIENIEFRQMGMYFYLQEVGELVFSEDGYLDRDRSQLIEAGFSCIYEYQKEISRARLWVSTGYWNENEGFIHRNQLLDKKYSSLVRYVKKLAPYTEIEMKSSNPRCNCRTYITKEYITPVFLEMIKLGGYSCT
ncbi:MAG: hypothetical protein MR593_09750 [Intestinibacter sp.]|uniref:hypothetical protein n=1 Tax=Intestinibacter sp. TaxID=1965304 RepID=UPI0025BF8FE9|nr:hypothetical protein [Intestinibacter sp.]MCI6738388.1 hypothetical protein [Intestinibacter sp.]